ncbi:MAG: LSU ribosomal protein L28p @ LSU ribosomal protein L28p, zinc-dependent, partial [uncultured Blastococcus sp.]
GCRVRCVWQGARFRYVGVALAPPHAAPLEPEHPVRAGADRPRQPSPDQRVHLVHPRRQGRARL